MIDVRSQDKRDLQQRLSEYNLFAPNQVQGLKQFQEKISARLRGEIPFEERSKLIDLLRVEVLYDYRSGDIAITGTLGDIHVSLNSGESEQESDFDDISEDTTEANRTILSSKSRSAVR